jgi:ADP-ribose pyrophosphatase YjhB (NUDIX family)
MGSSEGDRFARTRAEVGSVIAAALSEVEASKDDEAAYRQASWLVDTLGEATTASGRIRARIVSRIKESGGLSLAQLGEKIGVSKARAADMIKAVKGTAPEPQPVVAVIVTSDEGALITKRKDGSPPYGFVSGEIEPGESPDDAAVRKVKKETGCAVRTIRVLGRRVHPATGRTLIYLAAEPTQGTEVFVGDEAELDEVRWVTLAEADELLPGMFDSVRAYLGRALRPRQMRRATSGTE